MGRPRGAPMPQEVHDLKARIDAWRSRGHGLSLVSLKPEGDQAEPP